MKAVKPHWSVIRADMHEDYTIDLEFSDGSKGVYDAKPLLDEPFFEQLRDPVFFMGGHVEFGTVLWSDEVDIAPEHLYEKSLPC